MKFTQQRVVIGLFVLALLAAAGFAGAVHWGPKRALADYERQLRASGETLTIEELTPLVPPSRNGAAIFRQVLAAWNVPVAPGTFANPLDRDRPAAMCIVAPGKAMIGWKQTQWGDPPTNTWAEAEAALADEAENLELLRELIDRPELGFGLNYKQGPSLLLPHLAPLKKAAQRLSAAALCDLHRADTAAAVTNVIAMLAIARGMEGEPLAISQLVRLAIVYTTQAATWDLLQSPGLADNQLAVLQRRWTELEFIHPAESALAMERAMGTQTLEEMRASHAKFRTFFGTGPVSGAGDLLETAVGETKTAMWQFSWSYPDEQRMLQGYQTMLEAARTVHAGQPFATALRQQESRLAVLGFKHAKHEFGWWPGDNPARIDLHSIFSESIVSMRGVLNRVMEAEAARQLTVTAIALKRFQLRHNNYPPDLNALLPEILSSVPRDPVDGQPFRYRLNTDGTFLLYSVGEDGEDNGGDPSPVTNSKSLVTWLRGRDFVWPQPATPEEIAAHHLKTASHRHGN